MAEISTGAVLGGRFEILGVLGRGGSAVVYLADDAVRGERVALKVLHAHLDDPTTRRRLRREVRAAARLRHPHVLAAHELHEVDGRLALAMPVHAGRTLADVVVQDGPLSADAVRRLGEQLGGALAEAHARGIVHRDVTPGNVLVDDRGDAALTDFGLARVDGHGSSTAVAGTWGYAAPETFQARSPDPRGDVYGLGAVLYLAATGRPPFAASTPMGVLQKQLAGEFTPLSEARPGLPAALCDAVDAMLSVRPSERPAGARAAVDALCGRATGERPRPTRRPDPRVSHLPVGPWTVVVRVRPKPRGANPDSPLVASLVSFGQDIKRMLGLEAAPPEQQLAAAVAREAGLPDDALGVPPSMRTPEFRLVSGVSQPVARRLAEAAVGAGYATHRIRNVDLGPDAVHRVMTPVGTWLLSVALVAFVTGIGVGGAASLAPLAAQAPAGAVAAAGVAGFGLHRWRRDGPLRTHGAALGSLLLGFLLIDAASAALHGALSGADALGSAVFLLFTVTSTLGWFALLAARAVAALSARFSTDPNAAVPLAYPLDLRPHLAPGFEDRLPGPPEPEPERSEPVEVAPSATRPDVARALAAVDALERAIAERADALAAPMLSDLRDGVTQLRARAHELADRLAGLDDALRDDRSADAVASARRVQARLERLDALARTGAPSRDAERRELERALAAHQAEIEAHDDLEALHTRLVARLLEIAAAATQARRDLVRDAVGTSPDLLSDLRAEVGAAADALREVRAASARGQRT